MSLVELVLRSRDARTADGRSAKLPDAKVVGGPGATPLGKLDRALQLGGVSHVNVNLKGLEPDLRRFTVDVVMRCDQVPEKPATVLSSTALPFSIGVEKSPAGSESIAVVARVTPVAGAKRGASTAFSADIRPGAWHTVTLVYDTDTIGLLVDGVAEAVHAFGDGTLGRTKNGVLSIGADPKGNGAFVGTLAAVRWRDGVAKPLVPLVDELRSSPGWFVALKDEQLHPALDLGAPVSDVVKHDATGAWTLELEQGTIMYAEDAGVAFEMHGAIRDLYRSLADPAPLGHLVSDEIATAAPGGRKSLFSQGAVYWSSATGAVPVVGHLYLDYERLGESGGLGFPTAFAAAIPGGLEQVFEHARLYLREGASAAHELHGLILQQFLATGGTATWGFPTTDELPVMRDGVEIGRTNELERCTFFWSPASGAHEVHGDIRTKYLAMGGPLGSLGFPTSDEADVPNAGGARFNTFQGGALMWRGSLATMTAVTQVTLFLERIATDNAEGFGRGENDLYLTLRVSDNGTMLFDQRFPGSGDFGGHDTIEPKVTVPPIALSRPDQVLTVELDVWEEDGSTSSDEHIGTWVRELRPDTAWGLWEDEGILHSGKVGRIKDALLAVQPFVDPTTLTEAQKWWGMVNQGNTPITYASYATAFGDVDPNPQDFDPFDWLDKAFYELVAEGLAGGGNCFGMSLEAIYAHKRTSAFSLPLDRFARATVQDQFNVKHLYQVGAHPIWWFVGQFLSGNTHDPRDVFTATRDAHARGDDPVLCISQNYNFSGAPHAVLPVAWDSSSKPWTMHVFDPNDPGNTRPLFVDPDEGTYSYAGVSASYSGGTWTGGRMHYMPFHVLSHRQRTPVWDAILLILLGTVVVLADSAETVSFTTPDGKDLDGFGDEALQVLQSGQDAGGRFVDFKGFLSGIDPTSAVRRAGRLGGIGGTGGIRLDDIVSTDGGVAGPQARSVKGGLYLRALRPVQDVVLNRKALVFPPLTGVRPGRPLEVLSAAEVGRMLGGAAADGPAPDAIAQRLAVRSEALRTVAFREAGAGRVTGLAGGAITAPDFVHTVRGRAAGTLDHAIAHGLSRVRVQAPIAAGEQTAFDATGLGTARSVVGVTPASDGRATVRIEQRVGVSGDRVAVTLDGVPLAAGGAARVNARPGVGGVEVVAGGAGTQVDVTVEGRVQGRDVGARFDVPLDGGVRIDPRPVLAGAAALDVAPIGELFGVARDRIRLRAL